MLQGVSLAVLQLHLQLYLAQPGTFCLWLVVLHQGGVLLLLPVQAAWRPALSPSPILQSSFCLCSRNSAVPCSEQFDNPLLLALQGDS